MLCPPFSSCFLTIVNISKHHNCFTLPRPLLHSSRPYPPSGHCCPLSHSLLLVDLFNGLTTTKFTFLNPHLIILLTEMAGNAVTWTLPTSGGVPTHSGTESFLVEETTESVMQPDLRSRVDARDFADGGKYRCKYLPTSSHAGCG